MDPKLKMHNKKAAKSFRKICTEDKQESPTLSTTGMHFCFHKTLGSQFKREMTDDATYHYHLQRYWILRTVKPL